MLKVVNSKGYLANNYAFGGLQQQKIALEKEKIAVIDNRVDLRKYGIIEKDN